MNPQVVGSPIKHFHVRNSKKILSNRDLKISLGKGLFLGIAAIIAAIAFVYNIGGNPYHEYLLMKNGVTAVAVITDISRDSEAKDAGGNTYYYDYAFTFVLPNGNKIHSNQQLSGDSPQETPEVPSAIEIVYLSNRPEINKIKRTLSDNTFELLWRKVGLGILLLLIFSSIGFAIIKNSYQEYLIGKQQLKTL